jgi:SSS family solute:Na+ symporter
LLGSLCLAGARPARILADEAVAQVTPELRQRAVTVLRETLDCEARWIKVHAAEFLLALDYPEGVGETFDQELASAGDEPEYRIGIWRVLARAAARERDRDAWIGKIRDVFVDPDAPDRLHAVETLAKLGYQASKDEAEPFEMAARGDDGRMAAFASWVLFNSGMPHGEARLVELLASDDGPTRSIAAYALQHLTPLRRETLVALFAAAISEPSDSASRVFLTSAVAVHAHDAHRDAWRRQLWALIRSGSETERRLACQALAAVGQAEDLRALTDLLDDSDGDVRAAAACAILRLERRVTRGMIWLDWVVIALYGAGMLGIGWYYSKRITSTDDYLLGGRSMRPLSVGLSLFATLLSTITYLAWPGELIRFGPMMLAMIAAYPLVFLIAGWFMIPFIMNLKITSAYEVLETRLGLSVRMLGSTFFLAMRLAWMAVIIYATTDKVLVPLMGLDSSATPYFCALLGVITVMYTSMGGLRAVVLTDVTQTLILFGGAVLTIVLITIDLGGVGNWWPAAWPVHWPEPTWGFSSTARLTFLGAMMAHFTWWVCTAGSDQMAIQRYLATRDVRAARRVLGTSLWANVFVALILSAVGLALMAYFRVNPHLLPDGQTILSDSDTLFPRFIARGLPAGLSGLVVAGLLAAAMSSLSSGVNSSCSVITVDFIDRFRPRKSSEVDHVKLAKYVSVFVGAAVIALSSGVGMVQGNLLELAFKVVNLLTAPLFGLFFMAMFVRWATGPGTLVGAAFGLAVVVAISYWKEITGTEGISFIWAMPLSFVVQIGTGMLASLVPIGRRADRRP